jgi:hypothetical protein
VLGPLNHSRENRKLKSLCRIHATKKDRRVDFEPEVLEEETEWSEFSKRTPKTARTVGSMKFEGEVKCWIDPPLKGRI